MAVLVFPFHNSWRSLFEAIMAAIVATVAVVFGGLYFKNLEDNRVRDGLLLGAFW